MQHKSNWICGWRLLYSVCLLSILVSWMPRAHANDMSVRGTGGSWQPLKGEHPSIRMVSEKVNISVFDNYYLVTADFVFHNLGRATTVAMGFPESAGGVDVGDTYVHESGFKKFRTLVDGKPVLVHRTVLKQHYEEEYNALWIKRVHFKRGQMRRVRVCYQSVGGAYSDGTELAAYAFTGGNWYGDVAESVLTLQFRSPGTYLYKGTLESDIGQKGSGPPPNVLKRQKNGLLIMKRTHWQAQTGFSCDYLRYVPNGLDSDWMSERKWDANQSIISVPLPIHYDIDNKYFPRTTLGVQRGSTTFVNLQHLQGFLSSRTNLMWDGRDNSLVISTKSHRLRFWAGKAIAQRESGNLIPLASKPIHLSNHLGNSEWYVPLKPVLDLLGTTAEVNPQQHLLRIHYPRA